MKKTPLLQGYLENISGKVLEEYRLVIREMIRGRHGVYALYKSGKLYYVGLASNLINRIKAHTRDRHQKKWDRFSVYLTSDAAHIKDLECLVLCIVSPDGNKARGRFRNSENLFATLYTGLKETDADRRASILGGWVAERRFRNKARRTRGGQGLVGFTDRAMALRGRYQGKLYRASLRKTGTIRVGKKFYTSPSAAAKAVVKRAVNGWAFWHYRDRTGTWRPLSTIKK